MAFTAVFVNPFHETGISGSLYSVKDYFRLNPLFLDKGRTLPTSAALSEFVESCNDAGMQPVMDLVINHTAIDSPLVGQHRSWYKHDRSGQVSRRPLPSIPAIRAR